MTISLEDKKNIEQIFSEVTIQQLDLSEKYFDMLCTIMTKYVQFYSVYISFTSMTYFV